MAKSSRLLATQTRGPALLILRNPISANNITDPDIYYLVSQHFAAPRSVESDLTPCFEVYPQIEWLKLMKFAFCQMKRNGFNKYPSCIA